ncbi:N-acetyl-gamma-glutamyl-phosphate reductase [Rothia sp. ZJ1223]|uniref:N-acetyl-gamma-glutamyl-phosphate reductase n=1 Tax=Rothia sp. ZJ1223 TaxID=2811098 RepID=UPI00195E350C|nr:N-acetyl-gamma-glutamyl-phosphate reductase [Rothia sp. ZJ1223]MBM7051256.1 N-acetyl-gamma-glutamyl-phosphate reductase [Rothia sp. ZJ1223]
MSISVAVTGATGYAGGEVLRLLATHPEVEVKTVTAHSNAGQRLGGVAPHLRKYAEMMISETSPETLIGHDVVFMMLPHGASAQIAAQLPVNTLVIDAGADHRLNSAEDWEKFYQSEHAGTWPYGLPELIDQTGKKQREKLGGTKRVAVPGCYPTASLLALTPGFQAGVLDSRDVVIVAASGTSGAGKSAKTHLIGAEVMGGMSPYGVGGMHRHTPEIEQGYSLAAGKPVQISFTPTLAPMPRGILVTATAKVTAPVSEEELRTIWEKAYSAEDFVHLLPAGQWPSTKMVQGSNHAVMQLAYDAHAHRVIVTCVIDNLTKGTAGGAIQSMNIALNLPENLGLLQEGLAP